MSASRSSTPSRRVRLPEPLAGAARTAGADLGLWAGVQAAAWWPVLASRPMALAMLQAAWAEWGAGRLGITWSDPLSPVSTTAQIARRVGVGAAAGGLAALAVVVVSLVAGSASFAGWGARWDVLLLGLLPALANTLRDELLERGIVLWALRAVMPPWASVLSCGAVAAAARYGVDGRCGPALVVEGLRGAALATLWIRDRGAWMAWAANATWTWTFGAVVLGGLADVRFSGEADATAWAALVVAAAGAVGLVSLRGRAMRAA